MLTHSQPKAKPSIHQLLPVFQAVLTAQVVRGLLKDKAPETRFYVRIYSPLVVLWCLVFQRLNHDHTCDAVVSHVSSGAVDHLDEGHRQPLCERLKSASTAAFCKARARLPLAVLEAVLHHSAQHLAQGLGAQPSWLGHQVALLDGTTFLLRPEPKLVERYGQHRNHLGPTYWVVMRAVAAFGLHTGAITAVQEGSLHQSEQALAKPVLAQLPAASPTR